mmetsp:Transcript_40677/g.120637  ORF Transcript_40677/g.120637 Transcript_40677/m.120637 type:complete len:565 (-) Transcript_40677:58-1752(-)
MGGASSFLAILAICGFLTATWMATKLSKAVGISSIVLEIVTGMALGPQVGGLISKEYAECEHKRHTFCDLPSDFLERVVDNNLGKHLGRIANMDFCDKADYSVIVEGVGGRRLAGSSANYDSYAECLQKSCEGDISSRCGLTPDVFTMIGHAGVAMMIFESGMHFDFEKALIVGPKACVVAVFGTFLPLISGTILAMLYGFPLMPDGLSVGTALAPTSVGIALRLLGEANVLQEDFGQAIITAAFVDDILSLVLFNVLFSLGGDFDVMATVINPIIGIAFMAIAMVAAMKFWPWVICDLILPRVPEGANPKVARGDQVLFFIMMVFLLGYGTITHFLGTHLWGCFIAGMSFACLQPPGHAHHVWVRQTKRMTGWMIRIFFACTVAFSIRIDRFLSLEAFWKGSLLGIGPCVLAKVVCAPCMGSARWVIGWAMVGRAEFAYLIAQMAFSGNMIDEDAFSITIWALLYATVFAPLVFRYVLNKYLKETNLTAAMDDSKGKAVEDEQPAAPAARDKVAVEVGTGSAAAEDDPKAVQAATEIDDDLRSNLDEEGVKVQAVDWDGMVDM